MDHQQLDTDIADTEQCDMEEYSDSIFSPNQRIPLDGHLRHRDQADCIPQSSAKRSEAAKHNIDDLAQAFHTFNKMSADLDQSYHALQLRISDLNKQLSTTRKQQARELAIRSQQLDRLESLVSVLPTGLVVVDKHSIIKDYNLKACELLGEPLAGQAWASVVERVAMAESQTEFDLTLRDGKILSLDSRDLNHSGERAILLTEADSDHLGHADDESHDYQNHAKDYANRDKRLMELGEIASSLVHQIRTPLSSSILYMSQLALDELPSKTRKSMASRVQDRLAHMSGVIDSMLNFVRGAKPDTRAVSLASLLEKTQDLVRFQADQAGASLDFAEVDPALMIYADSDSLASALVNLIVNAMQMKPDKPRVSVAVCDTSPTQVEINVVDNGPGIASCHLERVFDPFFTTKTQGTGLGLAVAAMTISAHDGDISAHNRDAGGAEFRIRLPRINTMETLGDRSMRLSFSTKEVA